MNLLAVEAVGLMAPGLVGWTASQAVLAGQRSYVVEPMPATMATLLPANERRRITATIKLALQVAQEAMTQADLDAGTVPQTHLLRQRLLDEGFDGVVYPSFMSPGGSCVALWHWSGPVKPSLKVIDPDQRLPKTPASWL